MDDSSSVSLFVSFWEVSGGHAIGSVGKVEEFPGPLESSCGVFFYSNELAR
jgi:hypothetical protein